MTGIRTPRTLGAATSLLQHYAELAAAAAAIESGRNAAIEAINAKADADLAPLLPDLDRIREKIQPWWLTAGRKLAADRKSLELGGCMVGSRLSNPRLTHGFPDDDAAVVALRATRLGKQTTRVKYTLDRPATMKLLRAKDKPAATIGELGFKVDQADVFFLERIEQEGTIAPQ